MLASDTSLRLTEIFCSLQGESSWVGERTVFVRLTGCPLRCRYCDTAYAFSGGTTFALADVLSNVAAHDARFVCVTGGEPLAQPGCIALLEALCNAGYQVSLETSGALNIATVDSRVKRVVDFKTPSSGELAKNLWQNIELLANNDEVKIVIGSREDYEWAGEFIRKHQLAARVAAVLFSPVMAIEDGPDALLPRTLAEWILEDKLPVRMQIQQHKLIWGDAPGH
ncbi:MAG: 7-carboxy-7-deazaguanine synthase QueE [Gammaproteobacteria bacterium]|nr:7-carboxy-7-deazaguanine synthase QueE [Gammaproteobacteria bacterium]NND39917.1 7-carboxy-7-deazaguanine synthase QueE [Pseudomonadales bacterium]NNL11873.1 7-carboxy-7-deazaguanine synthase QueE [Pseudomonadales bacterium]NNM11536.1 7-carboxy-7-deazaguanine synthase QueE [Pseudomonadales bacterium]RZV57441.1 MAG: 7-carboxy-7-deazaguanine synthase QueE [Pseudomonadales bacterium]